jgi:hypothetical protein
VNSRPGQALPPNGSRSKSRPYSRLAPSALPAALRAAGTNESWGSNVAANAYREKVGQLDEKHPGLRAELDKFIDQGKNAHWISAFIRKWYEVRLEEDFIVQYANYHNIFAEGDEVQVPMEETAHSAASPSAGAGDNESSPAQNAASRPRGRKSAMAKGQNSEPREVTKSDIIKALKRKVAWMLRRVVADPDSEATEYVRILLLNEMANERLGYSEADFGKLVEAERKQADLAKSLRRERFDRQQIQREWKAEKGKLRKTMQNLEDATAQGMALDHQEIFKQISAVIGVGQPMEDVIEKQV